MTDPYTRRFNTVRNRLDAVLAAHPELGDALAPAVKDLADAAPTFTAAVERLHLAQRDGLGAQSFDGGRAGSDHGSVPERMALTGGGDPAADTIAELTRTLGYLEQNLSRPSVSHQRMCGNARTLWRIVSAWTPRKPSDKQRATVEAANSGPDPLCQHCTPHATRGNTELVHRTGTVAGNLDTPMPLGYWCYEFVRRTGRLPLKSEIQRRDNGQRVMVKA